MEISYLDIFNSKPVLEKAYMQSGFGKLKFAIKRNLRQFETHFEDVLEWLKSDAMDNDWDQNGFLPLQEKDFRDRFESFLKSNVVEIEPFYIPESYLEYLDGVTGAEEMVIGWLIEKED